MFEIESPPITIEPKYDKNNQLDFSLNKNIDVFKDLLHFLDSNDLIFRFFDIKITIAADSWKEFDRIFVDDSSTAVWNFSKNTLSHILIT